MKKSLAGAALVLILSVSAAIAHGNSEHIVGTVTATTSQSIRVETRAGEEKEVAVRSTTRFVRGETEVTLHDVHKGDRVVIHARKRDGKLEAEEVQLGTKKPSPRQ